MAARMVAADAMGWAGRTVMNPRCGRVASRSSGTREPVGLKARDLLRQLRRQSRSPLARAGEGSAPFRDLAFSESDEPRDVQVGPSRQNDRDRWHEAGCDTASAKDHVDEAPADPTVAIEERMDRLELGMGDRRLRDRWQIVAVGEGDQIIDQRLDVGLWRRDVASVDRRVEAAPDPVLFPSELTWRHPIWLTAHQCSVDRSDVIGRQRSVRLSQRDRFLHGDDVGRDGPSGASGRARIDERSGEVALGEVVALDPGRRDRL